ncbi:MAG TPA: prepilin-type N-terminal cleavage/methylation domain-containing protein [Acidimicrobiia bacterium]|jgi:type IV pilus assembly protein PilA
MLASTLAARRRNNPDEGFTLIELMVVVLIIAILIAIAIPTFLGARSRAQDRAAQSSLRNALTAAKTIYTDAEDYTQATPGASGSLVGVEPSLTFVGTASTGPNEIYVNPVSASVIQMSAQSKSNVCMWIQDNTAGPGTQYAKTNGACSTTAPTTWLSSW